MSNEQASVEASMKVFYPGLNRVLLTDVKEVGPSEGLVYSAQPKYLHGTISSVGFLSNAANTNERPDESDFFKVGDTVYILPQSGVSIDLDGITHRLINVTEILVGERNV